MTSFISKNLAVPAAGGGAAANGFAAPNRGEYAYVHFKVCFSYAFYLF
jgi:hypothetical protein